MAGVLVFLSLVGLGIKEFLKRWIDIVDFDAVEVDGGEGLAQAVVGFPIVTIGC